MSFDRLAPYYDWMEALTAGGGLQRARTAWLETLEGRRRILTVGEGHGRFAEACAVRLPGSHLDCVEASPRMVDRGRARSGTGASVRWHCCDVLAWNPREKYDAVVTCFFLDCFSPAQLAKVVAKLSACATEDAAWLVVDFAIPPRGFQRWRAQAIHALMYAFFRRTTGLAARRLTPPGPFLRTEGFVLSDRREFNFGLVTAELWHRGGLKPTD